MPAKLGYKQELRRNFTLIEVFGIAFSIMGLLPSIASTLAYSIPAGPVGMVWVRACTLKIDSLEAGTEGSNTGLVPRFRMYIHCWPSHGIYSSYKGIHLEYNAHSRQADLGSAMPTSGGLYWWTHFFSSPATRNPLCFLVGYSNTIGMVGGLCSIDCKHTE